MSKFNFDSEFFRRVISNCGKTIKAQSLSQITEEAIEAFYDEFDYYPDIAVFAPGSFTIMGDHLEYVKGHLVQGALPLVTVVVGKSLDTVKCKIVTTSKNAEGLRKAIFPISHYKKGLKVFPNWVNYIKGVIECFPCKNLKGFDVVIHSNIPECQGYGSSAALQVAFYTFLEVTCKTDMKTCPNNKRKAELCRLAEIKSEMCKNRIGQWNNFTSSIALPNSAVSIDCNTRETSLLDIKDLDILFLLTYPNFDVETNDRDYVRQREVELKLAAELLGLRHVKDATEEHLEVLANMEDPPRERVIDILLRFGLDEEWILDFVEELFHFSKVDSTSLKDDSFVGEMGLEFYEFGMSMSSGKDAKNLDSESENIMSGEIDERQEMKPEKMFGLRIASFEEDKKDSVAGIIENNAPPPSPSLIETLNIDIHQRIADLCKGRVDSKTKSEEKICQEINCLGGIENLSVSSELSVVGKLLKRLRHVVTEKMRCLALHDIINKLDYVEFGTRLIQSHLSLKIDYEVSCPTIDSIVQIAIETERVYGAKMMSGGGTLTLLHRSVVEELIEKLEQKFGDRFQFYLVFPSSGAKVVKLAMRSNLNNFLSDSFLTLDEVMKKAVEFFQFAYKYKPSHGAYSPVILNLLGDHTDYNHGLVLSFASNMIIVIVGAFNGTNKVRAATTTDMGDEPRKVIFSLSTFSDVNGGRVKWAKLIKGVIMNFKGNLKGFDCVIESNLPCTSGFASKTALSMALYTFLEELTEQPTANSLEKAYKCMLAQHESVSTLCGIGEHCVSLAAKENYAVLFDCRYNVSTSIPFQDHSVVILLTFAKVSFNPSRAILFRRLEECHEVAKAFGRKSLRCFNSSHLERLQHSKIRGAYVQRAVHIIREFERVLKAAEALKNNDFETLGELMVESHNSLRDLYEITSPEMDDLVKLAMEVDGVFGSKMSSSSHHTCTYSLVKRWAVDDLIEYLKNNFSKPLYFYVVNPNNGVGSLNIKDYVETLPGPEFAFQDIFRL